MVPTKDLRREDHQLPIIRYDTRAPEGTPKGSILLTHGYGEHSGRYEHVIDAWVRKGFLVAFYDLRGHGRSQGVRGHVEQFEDYVRDATDLLDVLNQESEFRALGKPIILGHSLGGLITFHLALAIPSRVRAVALSSPFMGLALKVSRAKRLTGRVFSRLVPKLALPTGIACSDLTHDQNMALAFERDPLRIPKATARWFTECLGAHEEALHRAPELTLPIFCLQGGADRIASVEDAQRVVWATRAADKTYRLLPNQYHEILNEVERQQTLEIYAEKMLGWVSAQ
jgi:alpha-beta hydrolase superfamily lysophospholipase